MTNIEDEPVEVRVEHWYRGKPSRISLYWRYNDDFLCGLSNKDALLLASRILQLQKGKPKEVSR
jgi:hypothetical protein